MILFQARFFSCWKKKNGPKNRGRLLKDQKESKWEKNDVFQLEAAVKENELTHGAFLLSSGGVPIEAYIFIR